MLGVSRQAYDSCSNITCDSLVIGMDAKALMLAPPVLPIGWRRLSCDRMSSPRKQLVKRLSNVPLACIVPWSLRRQQLFHTNPWLLASAHRQLTRHYMLQPGPSQAD